MEKPLGYYTTYVSGDDSYLFDIQKSYGSCLQSMSRREQLFLLYSLASNLCSIASGELRAEVVETAHACNCKLSNDDAEGLCEALINQIRWGNHDA